jgi:hypothetical protein
LLIKAPLAVLWLALVLVGTVVAVLFVALTGAMWLRDRVADLNEALKTAFAWVGDKLEGRP